MKQLKNNIIAKYLLGILALGVLVLGICILINGYKKHSITVGDGFFESVSIEQCPKSAKTGEVVEISLNSLEDVEIEVAVNGENIGTMSDFRTYSFVMPDENVEITAQLIDTYGIERYDDEMD